MENEIEFIQTSRGGESLVVDQKFKFRFHKHQGEKRYWKCVTENCKTRAHTDAVNSKRPRPLMAYFRTVSVSKIFDDTYMCVGGSVRAKTRVFLKLHAQAVTKPNST